MARLDEFHERFIPVVESFIRQTGNRTDNGIAQMLGMCRQTVARWRKKYPQLQSAINNPNLRVSRKVDALIEKNLDEPRTEILCDGDGNIIQKKIIPPSARDIEVAGKMGFGGTVNFNAREAQIQQREEAKTVRREIRDRLFSGSITYLEAAAECRDEDLDVPELWQAREIQRILSEGRKDKLPAVQIAEMIESSLLPVPRTLMLEVKQETGGDYEDFSGMAATLGDILSSARKRIRDEEKNDKTG